MQRLTLNRLRAYLETVRTGQVTTAAEAMGVSQPSTSQQLRQLQDYFGFEMLSSRSGRLTPSTPAAPFMPYFHRIDNAVSRIVELSGSHNGDRPERLYVGTTSSAGMYFIPAVLRAFSRPSRDPAIELIIGTPGQLRQDLMDGFLDIAFIHDTLIADPEIRSRSLYTSRALLIDTRARSVSAADLATLRMFTTIDIADILHTQLRETGIFLASNQIALLDNVDSVKKSVESGLGIGFVLEESIEREIAHGYIAIIDTPLGEIPVDFNASFPAVTHKQVKLNALMEFAHAQALLRVRSMTSKGASARAGIIP